MQRVPMVWAQAKIGVLRAIEELGGDPDRALAAVDLTRADLLDPERYIPIRQSLAIPAAGAEETGDDFFGLHWGERDRPEHLGVLAYVTSNSPTVRTALENLCRYISIVSQGVDLWTSEDPPLASIRYRVRDPSIENLRHNDEYVVALGLNLLRTVIADDWCPREVLFRHPAPDDLSEYERVFRAPIRFEQPYSGVSMDHQLLDQPNVRADAQLFQILETHADSLHDRMPPIDDLPGTVRSEIERSLANGAPSLEDIAARVAMSSRTLQRRLGEYGWRFQRLVDDTRRLLSIEFLADRKLPVTEIAFRTGYSELSAFARAFRRWTGRTPQEYRQELD